MFVHFIALIFFLGFLIASEKLSAYIIEMVEATEWRFLRLSYLEDL